MRALPWPMAAVSTDDPGLGICGLDALNAGKTVLVFSTHGKSLPSLGNAHLRRCSG